MASIVPTDREARWQVKNLSEFQAHLVPGARFRARGSVNAKLNSAGPSSIRVEQRWRDVNEKISCPSMLQLAREPPPFALLLLTGDCWQGPEGLHSYAHPRGFALEKKLSVGKRVRTRAENVPQPCAATWLMNLGKRGLAQRQRERVDLLLLSDKRAQGARVC
jgi:hypothetical protein